MALDCATACGWAVGAAQTCFEYGTKNLAPNGKHASPGSRYRRLRSLMIDTKKKFPDLKMIAFELPIFDHTSQLQKAYSHGYVAVIQLFCADHGMGYRGVHVSSLKKFITGTGRASKDEMIAAIKSRGYDPQDDNAADAIGIFLWATQ